MVKKVIDGSVFCETTLKDVPVGTATVRLHTDVGLLREAKDVRRRSFHCVMQAHTDQSLTAEVKPGGPLVITVGD